ncbi:unnamed protein product [Brachionus calyciflorus]|uniref:EGF-like domain-containing protein n=1 Tax=Brachionus calyciflorus TaxID=104777 RepID=A0A814JPX4_9BILA|nr:unnamed protein product [Brachionus calyciflorus]
MIIFFILIFSSVLKISSAQCLAFLFNETHIRIFSGNNVYLKQVTNNIITAADYDQENSVFLTGSLNREITITNILNKNMTILSTNYSISFILSVNMTHFLIKDNLNNLAYYDFVSQNFYPIVDPIGLNSETIIFVRLLKEDKLILIGTLSRIIVYDLQTNTFKVNNMTSIVYSLDFLNRNFIVCQCSFESICVYKLEIDNSLTQLITGKFNVSIDIFSIKIVNDSFILFGIQIMYSNPLCFWDLKKGTLKCYETGSRILYIETLGNDLVIFSQFNKYLNVLNTTGLFLNQIVTSLSVNTMKFIEKCNSALLDSYLVRENIPWTYLNNNYIENFLVFNTTKLEITNNNFVSTSISTKESHETLSTGSPIQDIQAIFNGQNIKALTNLITKNIETNACLRNCSGNGKCKLITNIEYGCDCNENYAGSSCEINILPCWSNPCKNNGSCINNLINRTYTCECFRQIKEIILYYGQNCELKKDICENETCSNNGICYDIENKAECKCFSKYYGNRCENESNEIKAIKTTIKITSIVAIIVLILFSLTLILFDISNIFCKIPKPKKAKSKITQKRKIKFF